MAILGKIYIVPHAGKDHLVRALTLRGAAKGLIQKLTESSLAGARLASQDDLIEILSREGTHPIIDVTATDDGGDDGEGGEPSGQLTDPAPGV
jgi:hypothetical protein